MMAKWPWRSRSMTSVFNNNRENPKMHIWCKFGDCSSNPLQVIMVIMQTSQISKNFKSKWPKWLWRTRSKTSIFKSAESILGCMFGANLVILAQICDELSHGQAKFTKILSQMAKMTLKVTVHDLHFQYQPKVSQDACFVQFWWF